MNEEEQKQEEKKQPKRDILVEMGYSELAVFEHPDFDNAIIGISEDSEHVIYSYEKMIECLKDDEGMTDEEAIEWIDYNTLRALPYVGQYRPIVLMDELIFADYGE